MTFFIELNGQWAVLSYAFISYLEHNLSPLFVLIFVLICYFEGDLITLFAYCSEHDFVAQLRGNNLSELVAPLVRS